MGLAFMGVGTALPPGRFTQAEMTEVARILACETEDHVAAARSVHDHTRIATRHLAFPHDWVLRMIEEVPYLPLSGREPVAADPRSPLAEWYPNGGPGDRGPTTRQRMKVYERQAAPLALSAARQALADAQCPADAVTGLITVSCTGFQAPGVDIRLIKELPLPATVQRTHVGFMGCHAAFNGLRVARAFADADPHACVLVCATELCSLHYHYGYDPKKLVGNALFADGSAAVLGIPDHAAPADAWRLVGDGSCLLPDCEQAMCWTIGDHGFEMTLSTKVPRLIEEHLRPWLEPWLGRHGLTLAEVPSWAVHPGGPRILEAVEAALGLDPRQVEDSWEVLARCGNMSSPTILFILDRMRRRQLPRPCVALGFGPGLVAEAMLFR
jgi:alkylresorcinol/alkylpyrone synthase